MNKVLAGGLGAVCRGLNICDVEVYDEKNQNKKSHQKPRLLELKMSPHLGCLYVKFSKYNLI